MVRWLPTGVVLWPSTPSTVTPGPASSVSCTLWATTRSSRKTSSRNTVATCVESSTKWNLPPVVCAMLLSRGLVVLEAEGGHRHVHRGGLLGEGGHRALVVGHAFAEQDQAIDAIIEIAAHRGGARVLDRLALHRARAVHHQHDVDRRALAVRELAGVDAQADADLGRLVGGDQALRQRARQRDDARVLRARDGDHGIGRPDLDSLRFTGGEAPCAAPRRPSGSWCRADDGRSRCRGRRRTLVYGQGTWRNFKGDVDELLG